MREAFAVGKRFVWGLSALGALVVSTACGGDSATPEGELPPDIVGTTDLTVTCSAGGAQVCPSSYGIEGLEDPSIELVRGMTYNFTVESGPNHPFYIKTVSAQADTENSYDNGVTNQGATAGTLSFTVPDNAPDTLFYQCSVHTNMTGVLRIVDAP